MGQTQRRDEKFNGAIRQARVGSSSARPHNNNNNNKGDTKRARRREDCVYLLAFRRIGLELESQKGLFARRGVKYRRRRRPRPFIHYFLCANQVDLLTQRRLAWRCRCRWQIESQTVARSLRKHSQTQKEVADIITLKKHRVIVELELLNESPALNINRLEWVPFLMVAPSNIHTSRTIGRQF